MSQEDPLEGISRTPTDDGEDVDLDTAVEKIQEELTVGDLDPEDVIPDLEESAANLEGIVEGREVSVIQTAQEQAEQELADVQRIQLGEEQIDALKEFGDEIDSFNQIIGAIQNTNLLLQDVKSLLKSNADAIRRGTSLGIKDANEFEFAQSNNRVDLVDDTSIQTSKVLIKADPSNNGKIYIGTQNVQVQDGLAIEPGERFPLNVNIVLGSYQAVAEEAGDKYSYMTLGRLGE